MWEDQLWENSWVVVAGKRLQVESFRQNLQKISVGREETLSQTILINHVEQISVPNFCGSFWKSWRENPSFWQSVVVQEPKIYPTTSLDENCIDFESQRDRNCYFNLRQTYLVLKLKFVKGHSYETYKTKENKKEPEKEANRMKKRRRRRSMRLQFFSLLKWITVFCTQFFPMLKCTSTTSKFTTLTGCMRTKFTLLTNSRGLSLNTKVFFTASSTTIKNFPIKLQKRLCFKLFYKEKENT